MSTICLNMALSLLAIAAPDTEILNVRFTNGTFARVQVLGFEGDRVTLRELVLDGSMEVRHKLSDFEPRSSFRIELEARQPNTFDAHFAMARRAAELGLSEPSGKQALAAIAKLENHPDKSEKIAMVETWAAKQLERWLRGAIERGDIDRANHFLELLSTRFAHLRTEEQLDDLAGEVERLENDRSVRRRTERQARLSAKVREKIEKQLQPIRRTVKTGDELLRRAIRKSNRMTQSTKLASRAISSYRAAWKTSAELQKKHPDDEPLTAEIESLANHIHSHAIRAALHAANMLTIRSDFRGAMQWVQKILALDPTNEDAKQMKRMITIAGASASWAWGWGLPLVGGTPGRKTSR